MAQNFERSDVTRTLEVGLEGTAFALIQVHPGHEAAFDRWYGDDHFYSGGVLAPGVLSGRRWLAGRRLRAGRFVAPQRSLTDPYAGNHLAIYWLTVGGLQQFFSWVRPQLPQLRAEGRMFEERTQVNADGYRREQIVNSPNASLVNPVVALDHDFPGLFVCYGEPVGTVGEASANLPEGALTITFRPEPGSLEDHAANPVGGGLGATLPATAGPIRMTLVFLQTRPPADAAWSAQLAHAVGKATGCEPVWGGGFVPINPGADEYLTEMR